MQKLLLTFFLLIIPSLSLVAKGKSDSPNRPFCFLENKGQVKNELGKPRPEIDYVLHSGGMNIFISSRGITYEFSKSLSQAHPDAQEFPSDPQIQMYKMSVEIQGGDRQATALPEGKQAFLTRFYEIEGIPGDGHYRADPGIEANSWSRITYKDIYPDIDWVLYTNDGKLEYDFVVRPGGDPARIKLKYTGADKMSIAGDGSLVAETPLGTLREQAPYSTQQNGKEVRSSFMLSGDVLSFSVDKYAGILTIDPVLSWSTYYGAMFSQQYYDINVDGQGHVYASGQTSATSNIVTDTTTYTGGSFDGFISKFDTAGNLLWTTYWGTPGSDNILGIVSGSGFVYIAANSSQYSTSYCSRLTDAGVLVDGFMTQTGTRLEAIERDDEGNLYLGGNTTATTGVATIGAYQMTKLGPDDGYLAKVDTGMNIVWCTYFGGNINDKILDLSIDNAGHFYICGNTTSSTGMGTVGQTTLDGIRDGFVAKFRSVDGFLIWSTLLGGDGLDYVEGIAVDTTNLGAVFVTGTSSSDTGLTTLGAYQEVLSGPRDAFFARLDTLGILEWTTYFGGSDDDWGIATTIDETGVYSCIGSSSSDVPVIDAWQNTYGGGNTEGGIVKFTKHGQLIWSSYFGGNDLDPLWAIEADGVGNLYFAGGTNSLGLGYNTNVQLNFSGGVADAILVKIAACNSLDTIAGILLDTSMCIGDVQMIGVPEVLNAASYTWSLSGGISGASNTDSILITATGAGPATISVRANGYCDTAQSQTFSIVIHALPDPQITNIGNVLNTGSFASYQWNMNGSAIAGANGQSYTATADGSYTVTVTDTNGCVATSVALPLEANVLSSLQNICIFPNPNSGSFTIEGYLETNDGRITVSMQNVTGDIVFKNIRKQSGYYLKEAVNVNMLPAGVYLLRVVTDRGSYIGHVVKL